jgi:hypothetical protein
VEVHEEQMRVEIGEEGSYKLQEGSMCQLELTRNPARIVTFSVQQIDARFKIDRVWQVQGAISELEVGGLI